MATEADASGDGADENDEVAPEQEGGGISYEEGPQSYEVGSEEPEDFPHFIEIWNDYDPSQRFTAIFPVGEKEGAVGSSVAYYIIEPGSHTGLHNDNVEEIAFVAEGEGEVFSIGEHATARGRQVLRLRGGRRPRHLRARRASRSGCSRSSRRPRSSARSSRPSTRSARRRSARSRRRRS